MGIMHKSYLQLTKYEVMDHLREHSEDLFVTHLSKHSGTHGEHVDSSECAARYIPTERSFYRAGPSSH